MPSITHTRTYGNLTFHVIEHEPGSWVTVYRVTNWLYTADGPKAIEYATCPYGPERNGIYPSLAAADADRLFDAIEVN